MTNDHQPLTDTGAALALSLAELRDQIDLTLATAGGILVRHDVPYDALREATQAIAHIGRLVVQVGEGMTDNLDQQWDTNYEPRLNPESVVARELVTEHPTMHPSQVAGLSKAIVQSLIQYGWMA